ncbi:MarR family winged helix-turn-helix transcriptional regulator [Corynebacterium doosanense]|uniref:MarR family transcriptional regulator n=1 Tax=Corynebacterium doosanense CAU 212 = DSM 45436 TaxID=558173 RepID=A0A097IFI8_9CORY|nr:MarR family transcriptional regulator [Corynebacterium doosanense]AIT60906.1 MarR family transcriptional regulator [Corynebacterium doosanense CAU 212 = DSM 45436]
MTQEPRWLNPEQTRTWLALWSVSEWMSTRLDEQLKRDEGVGHTDYFPLAQISMAPGEQLTMTELAGLSNMSPSRLSHVVSRLEDRGWVKREASPTDRRTNIARLTDAGRHFVQRAAPGHVEHVRSLIFDGLTDEENRQLGDLLTKVMVRINPPALPRA